jgi:isopenicillin N synthase-like dioxygenase
MAKPDQPGPAAMPVSNPISMARYDADFDGFAAALGAAYERWGFAVVSDHGVDQALIDRANAAVKDFFALPEAAKRAYAVPGGAGQRGYTPFKVETAKDQTAPDLKEFWHTGRTLPAGHPYRAFMPDNLWPAEVPDFEPAVGGLFAAMDALGARLLRAIARFLDLPVDYFAARTDLGNSILRLLHYPPIQGPADGVRAGAHEDINVITLLLGAQEAGLQLLDRDGQWLDIKPPQGALVVNIGDMLQRLTNHRLPSTTHRVVNPAPERAHLPRYSTPFFLHFNPDVLIETLESCVTPDRPDRYPAPITADAFLQERLREIKLA